MLILQNTTGTQKHLTDRTKAHHEAYAKLHDHIYALTHFPAPGNLHPCWSKIPAIISALRTQPDDTIVLWLDADALIMPKHFLDNLEGVLKPDKDIGLVRVTEVPPFDNISWLNAGVIFIRNNAKTRELFRVVLQAGPMVRDPGEQRPLNIALANAGVSVQELDKQYNSYNRTLYHDPIIKAFHGITDKNAVLKEIDRILTTPTLEAATHG